MPSSKGDRTHAPDEPLRRFLHPIAGDERPHGHSQTGFACSCRKPKIADAERRTKPTGRDTGCHADSIVAALNLFANLSRAEPEKIWMCICVIAEQVAAGEGFSYKFWAVANKTSDQKERRARFVAVEQVQQLRRDRWVWPIIKSDGQLAG